MQIIRNRKKQLLHFKKEKRTTQDKVGCLLGRFLAGVLLRKWNFLKLITYDSSLFFWSENCFPRKEKPKCNIASALLSLIYDKGNRLTNTTEHRVAQNTVWKYLNIKKKLKIEREWYHESKHCRCKICRIYQIDF